MGTKQAKLRRHPEFTQKVSAESEAEVKFVRPEQTFGAAAREEGDWTLMKLELREKHLTVSAPGNVVELQSTEPLQVIRESHERQMIAIRGTVGDGEMTLLLRFHKVYTFLLWSLKLREAKRPAWEDLETPVCSSCSQQFSTLKRQHHCRHCGRAVCASCSPDQALLPGFGYYTPQRVCNLCSDQLIRTIGATRSKSTVQVTVHDLRESIGNVKSRDKSLPPVYAGRLSYN